MIPYYDDGTCVIYHGDCLEVPELWAQWGDVLVTDPPYGIGYSSGAPRQTSTANSCANDHDTSTRDAALQQWGDRCGLVFGSWRRPVPNAKAMLVWDQGPALGMGDLSIPWKPSWQGIFVVGGPWPGGRDSGAVIACPPVQSMASNGRVHPFEKPVRLLTALLARCPGGEVVDPFMGSGTTLRAAKDLGRKAVGIELSERYCEIAANRLAQEVLPL